MVYYQATTITTVGFGDFHPVTDLERTACCLILLTSGLISVGIVQSFM